MASNVQEVQDAQGFVVLLYTDADDMAADEKSGLVEGSTVDGSIPKDCVMAVVGKATAEEWIAQCDLCGDAVRTPGELPAIGYLKVVAE